VEEVLGKMDVDFVSPELASQYIADEQALMGNNILDSQGIFG
jgi:hypothetical protein